MATLATLDLTGFVGSLVRGRRKDGRKVRGLLVAARPGEVTVGRLTPQTFKPTDFSYLEEKYHRWVEDGLICH